MGKWDLKNPTSIGFMQRTISILVCAVDVLYVWHHSLTDIVLSAMEPIVSLMDETGRFGHLQTKLSTLSYSDVPLGIEITISCNLL